MSTASINRLLGFALLLLLTISACKKDSTSAGPTDTENTETSTTDLPPVTNNTTTPPPSVELPYSCTVLNEDVIREVFDYPEDKPLIPVHGQVLGSCYYQLTTEEWSADLVLEPIKEADKSAMEADIASATGTDRTSLSGHPARWHNDGRILIVGAPKPYAVKLSVLPRGQYGQVVDSEQRRAWITEIAEAVVGKL